MLKRLLSYGLYLLLLILPFQTRYIIEESSNPFGTISVYGFDILLVVLTVIWVIYWYHQPQYSVNWLSVSLGVGVLLLATAAAYFAEDKNLALYYWLHLALGLLLVVLVATTPLRPTIVLSLFVLNGCIQTVAGILEFVTQHVVANTWLGVANQLPELSGVSVVATATGRWLRAYALMPHPNIAAGIITLALVASALLSKYKFMPAVTGLLTFGLFLTFSRSAFIIWLVLLALLVVVRKVTWPVLFTSLGGLLVCVAIYWPLVASRVAADNYVESISLSDRREQLVEFQESFVTHWPLGVGLGQYTLTATEPIHNVPLLITIELGVFGMILWFIFLFYPVYLQAQAIQHHPASYLLLACIGLGITDHYFWTIPSLLFLWLFILGWLYLRPTDRP